jgi:predicted PurR-regulated permease PerM
MQPGDRPYTFDRVVRMILSALTVVVLLALLRYLSDVLIPFAAAVVFAYLLNPLVNLVNRRIKHRGLAVTVTIGGIGILGMVLLAVLTWLMFVQVNVFAQGLRDFREDVVSSIGLEPPEVHVPAPTPPAGESATETEEVDNVGDSEAAPKSTLGVKELREALYEIRTAEQNLTKPERLAHIQKKVAGTYVGAAMDAIADYMESPEYNKLRIDLAKRIGMGGWTVLTFVLSTVLGLTGLIIVLLYLVFLLVDYPLYARDWKLVLPPAYRDSIVGFLEEFNVALRRYFRGQFVVAAIVGALFIVGFSLVGLPMAVPMGLLMGLLNMVPYLQIVGLIPALLLAVLGAVQGDSSLIASVVWVLVVVGVVQTIQDAVITPRIMGKATGLKPVAILLGVFVWGKLLGFLGLILAIPLTCLGIAYYRRFVLGQPAEGTRRTES